MVRVVEVEAAVAVHQVEAVVGLIAKLLEQLEDSFAVALRDGVVEVAVLALQGRLARAGRVGVDTRAAEKLQPDPLLPGRLGDALGLLDGVLMGLGHSGAISMTMVFRSVICSSAKRPTTRPMPLFLPALPPKGRCASQ